MGNDGTLYRMVPVSDSQMFIKVPEEEEFIRILDSIGYKGLADLNTQLMDFAGTEVDVIMFSGCIEMSLSNAIGNKNASAIPFRKDVLIRALLKDYPEAIKLLVDFGSLPPK
jgi:hypothetical protein